MSLRRVIDILSLAIVALAAVFVTRLFLARIIGTRTPGYYDVSSIPEDVLVAASTGHRLGPEDAPVAIMVFWDYGCSFCREFEQTLRATRDRYPEHVAVVMKHFVPLTNDPVFRVALGAECAADQGVFAQYHARAVEQHDVLGSARGWRTIADSAFSPEVDRPRFDTCVQSAALASNVARDYEQGRALGVDGTPTSFINGERLDGASTFESLDSLVVSQFARPRLLY